MPEGLDESEFVRRLCSAAAVRREAEPATARLDLPPQGAEARRRDTAVALGRIPGRARRRLRLLPAQRSLFRLAGHHLRRCGTPPTNKSSMRPQQRPTVRFCLGSMELRKTKQVRLYLPVLADFQIRYGTVGVAWGPETKGRPRMPSIEQYRRYAAACRRLAETQADETWAQELFKLAEEFEAKAAKGSERIGAIARINSSRG